MSSSYVWVQLYYEGKDEPEGQVFKIKPAPEDVADLTEAVKTKRGKSLEHCDAADLSVYQPGTDFSQADSIRPGKKLAELIRELKDASDDHPLIVVAPAPAPQGNAYDIPVKTRVRSFIKASSVPVERRTLRTQFQQQQQQQQLPPNFSENATKGLEAMGEDYLQKKKTIVLSEATMAGKNDLLDMMQLPERGASWESKPAGLSIVDTFNWLTCDEDHQDNRCAYMAYLNQKLKVPATHSLVDTQSQRSMLSVTFLRESEESRNIRGTTDVAIVTSESSANQTIRNNIETQFELKKPEKLQTKDHAPQVVGEHFAASYLNRDHPVVSVLTDLNNSWTFYWFAQSNDVKIALYKLYLTGEAAATEAIYILDSLYDDDDSRRESLPITFSNRLPFEAVFKWVTQNKSKRGRGEQEENNDDGNDSTHHNKKKRDRKDQEEKDGGDSKPQPSNSEGCVSSSESGGTAHSNNQGGASMSMASALSLFAPPSSRDVANELDLLDMVDENEEYEIVRSFAMQHIVPYMRGQD